jgi:hypothetical protein
MHATALWGAITAVQWSYSKAYLQSQDKPLSLHSVRGQNGFFDMALTEKNM